MILKKWNYNIHEYKDYKVPKKWNCLIYSDNMDEVVNCPHCGKELKFGDTYTSLEIHTPFGFGYGVCKNCYEKERERRKKNEKRNNNNV